MAYLFFKKLNEPFGKANSVVDLALHSKKSLIFSI